MKTFPKLVHSIHDKGSNQGIYIMGIPGSGKTTLSLFLGGKKLLTKLNEYGDWEFSIENDQ